MQIHVAKQGKQSGPYAVEQVQEMVRNGLLASTDLGWHDAMKEWAPLHTIPELGLPPPTGAGGLNLDLTASGPAIGGGGPPADRVKRLVAVIIDGLIYGVLFWGVFGASMAAGFGMGAFPAMGVGVLGFGVVLLGYLTVQGYLLTTRGQTLGKIAMGIRIVRFEDGGNPGFVKAVLLRAVLWFVIGWIPVIGFLITLVDILFIFRDDQRCLHDHVAGTYVVPVQPGG
jgi:uncharacterized RDD family membrane protein YckC